LQRSEAFILAALDDRLELRCRICEARDWLSGTVYDFDLSQGAPEFLSVVTVRAENHWNKDHDRFWAEPRKE
jgi:hypothetical protein